MGDSRYYGTKFPDAVQDIIPGGGKTPFVHVIKVNTETTDDSPTGAVIGPDGSIIDVVVQVDVATSNNVQVALGTGGSAPASFATGQALNTKGTYRPSVGTGKRGDVGADEGGPVELVTKMSGAPGTNAGEVYIYVTYVN